MSQGGGADERLLSDVAIVAIGRNEGERLRRCLTTGLAACKTVVYVDSGSTDGSLAAAAKMGATIVSLDLRQPFTAARARNAGFAQVTSTDTGVVYVQFVDGDCEFEPGWLEGARKILVDNPDIGAVFGRRRERFPDKSIYNRLCDIEWNVPPGDAKSCGGDVMVRADALQRIGGYRADMIAGEEPEMCVRLRGDGWRILCLPLPMTVHDAAMSRFAQWWRRTLRSGHAFAQGASLHGKPPEYHCVKEARRNWVWGLGIPLVILGACLLLTPAFAAAALIYPAQIIRLYLKRRGTSDWPLLTSFFHVLGRFPETAGQIKFHVDRLLGRTMRLIEYK